MDVGTAVKNLIAKADADAVKVKAALLKAVAEVDGVILPAAEAYEPLVASVANAIAPGGGAIVNVANTWLELTARLLDAGGTAVESNLLNAGFDAAAISQIKTLVPQLKAAAVTK